MERLNIVVLGLDETNLELLRRVPDADRLEFHGLLTVEELQLGDEIPVAELLGKAESKIAAFEGRVDAIVGFWDFPVSTLVPVLCQRFGLRGASLGSVLRCEHKYWSRLVQREVIDEYPPFGLVDLDEPRPPANVGYPCWLKPVKSFSSKLAFEVTNDEEFETAVAELQEGVARVGEPFEYLLDMVDLPPAVADAGGQAVLAERALSGDRAAVEGHVQDGRVVIYGVLDSLVYPDAPCFLRHQYPSQLPTTMQERLAEVSRRLMHEIGFNDATFSIEYFCDADTGEVNVLEINPRHSQSHADLFEHVDGFPNHHYMLKAALGEDPGRPGAGKFHLGPLVSAPVHRRAAPPRTFRRRDRRGGTRDRRRPHPTQGSRRIAPVGHAPPGQLQLRTRRDHHRCRRPTTTTRQVRPLRTTAPVRVPGVANLAAPPGASCRGVGHWLANSHGRQTPARRARNGAAKSVRPRR